MTFQQLIGRYNWLNIEAMLLSVFPEQQVHLAAYEQVYQALLLLPVSETDLKICLEWKPDGETGKWKVDVSGRKQTPHIAQAGMSIPYALAFTPWSQWLAMPLTASTLRSFAEVDIIVYCLFEMTSQGFDEASIQAVARQMGHFADGTTQPDDLNGGFFMSWEQIIRFLRSKE